MDLDFKTIGVENSKNRVGRNTMQESNTEYRVVVCAIRPDNDEITNRSTRIHTRQSMRKDHRLIEPMAIKGIKTTTTALTGVRERIGKSQFRTLFLTVMFIRLGVG